MQQMNILIPQTKEMKLLPTYGLRIMKNLRPVPKSDRVSTISLKRTIYKILRTSIINNLITKMR